MKRAFQIFFITLAIFFAASLFMGIGGMIAVFDPPEERVGKASILALEHGHLFPTALLLHAQAIPSSGPAPR